MPHCAQCQASFEITKEDKAFYASISPTFGGKRFEIPPPKFCFACRLQRRLSHINIRTLYNRPSSHSGKSLVTIYAPEKELTVYEPSYWWGDDWSALDYAQDYDSGRPVFDQLAALYRKVPLMALTVQGNENADYINYAGWDKNCYLCFCTDHSEDCLYTQDLYYCKDSVDCSFSQNLELCYECTDCRGCYQVLFSQQAHHCRDSAFLYDCIGCHDCLGCWGLRQKAHHIFNQPVDPEKYEAEKKRWMADLPALKAKFEAFKKEAPRKAMIGEQNEDVSGNYLYQSKHAAHCFDCTKMEDSAYCTNMKGGGHHCYDMERWGHPAEYCYECCGVGEGANNIHFCACCWNNVHNLHYCQYCIGCQDCFGCVGLRGQRYCVFNKPYSPQDYESVVAQVIADMQAQNSWGEFFPVSSSLFAYNESAAQDVFPLDESSVRDKGWVWRKMDDPLPEVRKVVEAAQVPDSIQAVNDAVLGWAIRCGETRRPFKIVKKELAFYRRMNLPLPRFHPDTRHRQRVALRNPLQLWTRKCQQCQQSLQTSYAPDRPEKVYCEACYLEQGY